MSVSSAPVIIKKYANRRLYDTEVSAYITLENLMDMVKQDRAFVILDARTGDDITRGVLAQVMLEEETRGRAMLPVAFLRQLIRCYGDRRQGEVSDYLERMMAAFMQGPVSRHIRRAGKPGAGKCRRGAAGDVPVHIAACGGTGGRAHG
ncbi:polyhydroxyalkanoate synthesis repressor PhaR [Komagataeibacter rhaeticus]|nr:polyhydroxyalkanoate synthesis repressor PhaR [Komagataeibacter rhaeticus]